LIDPVISVQRATSTPLLNQQAPSSSSSPSNATPPSGGPESRSHPHVLDGVAPTPVSTPAKRSKIRSLFGLSSHSVVSKKPAVASGGSGGSPKHGASAPSSFSSAGNGSGHGGAEDRPSDSDVHGRLSSQDSEYGSLLAPEADSEVVIASQQTSPSKKSSYPTPWKSRRESNSQAIFLRNQIAAKVGFRTL
jgi:hypothetical protein